GIPVYCILGDKQARALSEHFSHGILNLNFGTTSSLSLDIGSKLIVREGFLSNVQFSTSSSYHYFIEGLVNSTGALLEWLAKKRQSKHLLQDMESAYRACASQSLPIFYFPLRGIGSPFWQYDLPSIATQLPKPNTDVFLASCVEHIAFSISSLILQLRATAGIPSIELLQVSGGLSEITTLVQLISNITKLPCKVHLTASSALGAARAYELHHQAGKENRLQSPPEVFPKAHGELQDRFDTWKVMEKALLDRTHSQFSVIPL
ncbi:MAG: hypothetical protein KDD62_04450, partial [Bdellovibrionales bacterium]|nr:hypothetical protein [Bdellovibrionales bacterium]